MFRKYNRHIAALGCSVVGVAGVSAAYALATDEGARRSAQFWVNVFPIYTHYRMVKFLNKDVGLLSDDVTEKMYLAMHDKYTDRVKETTYRMRGFYLKQAQLMSTRDDFVPKAYMVWLKETQDNVPSVFVKQEAKEYVRSLLKEELSLEFDDVFTEWDDVPLGVASIGQAHQCKLVSTGETVVVKFQLPNMERCFRSDIRTLKAFSRLAMPQFVTAFDEIEKQFTTEFDYRAEASNLSIVRSNIMPTWSRYINIPAPQLTLCSKHLLTMEFLQGPKLVDGIRNYYLKLAAESGFDISTIEELKSIQKELLLNGRTQFVSLESAKRWSQVVAIWMWMKDMMFSFNPLRFLSNISPLRFIFGSINYKWSDPLINLAQLLEILCRVHAHEIFRDGFFNGDCHPGNILLLSDGRLGLIDYGQVKSLAIPQRISYAKLIIALANNNVPEIVRLHFDEIGAKTKYHNERIGYLNACVYHDRNTPDVCDGMHIGAFIDWLETQDPVVLLPSEYVFCARVSIMMRGMGSAFGLQLRVAKLWEDEARMFLKSQGINYF
jgi:aarF domain-containing kinase